jgi:hypothetical protein
MEDYSKTEWDNSKAWVNALFNTKWIHLVFLLVDTTDGKCIILDSNKAHIAKNVKNTVATEIALIVIPGGQTPY